MLISDVKPNSKTMTCISQFADSEGTDFPVMLSDRLTRGSLVSPNN